jgi:hypothetical protein
MKEGLWHRVIKDKYFPFGSVARWLRSATIVGAQGLQTWRNLLKSLHILLHWIAWSLGTGESIIIGKDRILGMGEATILSDELISILNQRRVHYLYQASSEPSTWHDLFKLDNK